MIRDITLGQYFPGNSALHKMDPRFKLIITMLFIVTLFVVSSVSGYLLMTAAVAVCIVISGISMKLIMRGLKPLLFVIIFTALINMFYTSGQTIWEFWIFKITVEGILTAILMLTRILLLIAGTSLLLSYTTSPIMLTDGMEYLLGPFKKIGLPAHELAMMMTIALRFIPTLIEETEKIMDAQVSRGADFENGGLIKRSKAMLPLLIPLFISAFRRADELAIAMECRCYRGGEGRTRLRKLQSQKSDFAFLALTLLFCSAVILLSIFFPIWRV